MADRVTRCPKCSTSFRITDTQLQSAKGAVRCGSCLSIFKAMDHLVEAKPATTAKPQSTPSAKTAPVKAKPAASQAKAKAKPAAAKPKPPVAKPKAPTAKPKPVEEQANRLSFDQSQIDEDDSHLHDDDILISDDMDKSVDDTQKDMSLGNDLSESFLYFYTPKTTATSLFEHEAREAKEEENDLTDESWAVDLLNDLDEEPAPKAPALDDDDPDFDYSSKTTGTFQALDDETLEQALGEPLSSRPEPRFSLAPAEAEEELQEFEAELEEQGYQLNQDMLDNIAPDVVEIEQVSTARTWPKRLLWGGLSAVALLGLIGQIGYAKFDHLSRVEPYRDYYATACGLLGCQLPALTDRSQIKTHNLVIRSHPKVDNALVVDAIIFNSAPFQQTFPPLTLTFTDLSNKIVATRRFAPGEYLGGELAGQTIMPKGQPIHLSLEIVDPGTDAVNYRLESTD